MNETILIVEDDKNIIEGLTDILSVNGYEVISAANKSDTLDCLKYRKTNLIIMDVNLGQDNGFDICKQIRTQSNVPILFLTACDSEMELVRGFQSGGDDYITKPFRMQELIVRIQALLRRSNIGGIDISNPRDIYSGDICFHANEYRITKADVHIELTSIEFKIVSLLLGKWPETIKRETLFQQIWESEFVEPNTINVNISRIREKLGKYKFKIILTQGLNRQIRRMCRYLGYEVQKLKRIRIMNLTLDGIREGEYREITAQEWEELNHLLESSTSETVIRTGELNGNSSDHANE